MTDCYELNYIAVNRHNTGILLSELSKEMCCISRILQLKEEISTITLSTCMNDGHVYIKKEMFDKNATSQNACSKSARNLFCCFTRQP